MKLCINCKHYDASYSTCNSPANGISPVDGKPKAQHATIQRLDAKELLNNLCGPDGDNFKPFPPAPKLSELIGAASYSKTETVSHGGFLSVIHQYWSRISK